MKRDLNRLAGEKFDVLVIGGGIHGAVVAYEAAKHGLAVALIEQKDFSSATSANSLKIIHGGIRYFQDADLFRIRESILSRREMMSVAEGLIKPLPCMIPTHGFGIRGREVMRLVLQMYDLIAYDRNKGLPGRMAIPAGRILSKRECLALFPEASLKGLTGAALWYDALAVDTERIPLTYVLEATERGAMAANYLKAIGFIKHRNRIIGVETVDGLTGQRLELKTGMVINASGPWVNESVRSKKFESLGWVKGINLVIRKKMVTECAVGLEKHASGMKNKTGRDNNTMLFMVPWRGCTLIGTLYQPYTQKPETLKIEESDIREFVDLINASHPPARLNLGDVSFFHCGLLPSRRVRASRSSTIPDSHAEIVDHEKTDGIGGIISIKSVKYTTAPRVAKKLMEVLKIKGLIRYRRLRDEGYFCSIPRNIEKNRDLDALVIENAPISKAEILFAIREEMACKLSDMVFRRTNMGTVGCPKKTALLSVAGIMAAELGWTPERIETEIDEVYSRYQGLPESSR